ncbi:hypothetical protein ABIB00_005990 [Bradyrhizobium sp. LB14.3]
MLSQYRDGPPTAFKLTRRRVLGGVLSAGGVALLRFMLDYLHGNLSQQASPVSIADVGSKFDAVAMRTRFAF